MSKLVYWVTVSVVCAISIFLTFYHATYTGDKVASVFGYFFSLVIVPLLIVSFVAWIARVILPFEFSQTQKWLLFICPIGCMAVLLVCFYLLLQYGPH
jgi:hypothetical protein